MQAGVGSLLLITSTVMLSCFVVSFAVSVAVQVVENQDVLAEEQLARLNSCFNQTVPLFNQTQPPVTYDASPLPP
ncbi:MAG: hypothetical protein NWE93_04990 [Candidatus Bathyarchaeota archaeon]|nr:hypothetical protein [Candidatus Bathyarchaeota archaeon]